MGDHSHSLDHKRIDALEQQTATQEKRIHALEHKIQELNTQAASDKAVIQEQQREIASLSAQVTALSETNATLEATLAGHRKSSASLSSEVASLRAAVAEREEVVTTQQAEIRDLDDRIEALTAENTAMKTQLEHGGEGQEVSVVEAELEAERSAKAALNAENETLIAMVQKLQLRLIDHSTDLEEENHRLRQYIERLSKELLRADPAGVERAAMPPTH